MIKHGIVILIHFLKDIFSFCTVPVISRNILTDPASSQPSAEEADSPAVESDSSSPTSELNQSASSDGPELKENPENATSDGTPQSGSQSGNSSVLVAGQTEGLGLRFKGGGPDPAKPGHADEM